VTRPVRLAALGLLHESNTFVAQPTERAAFEGLRGAEIWERYADSRHSMAGFHDAHDPDAAVMVEPLRFSTANPRGPIAHAAFEALGGEMLAMLRDRGPWDGVLMAQHGAAVGERHLDADAELVARARAVVGPDVPIAVALDLHGNLSRRLIDASTIAIAYRTNPHGDPRERARECAALAVRAARGEIRPVQAWVPVPLVPNILDQSTDRDPMQALYAALAEVEERPGMLSASIMQGYPYADVPDMSMGCLAIADGDASLAQATARELAAEVWRRRDEMDSAAPDAREAVARAAKARGPVVLLDVGDNIGAGSPGDSTVLLEEALRQGVRDVLLTLRDPEAVRACEAAGAGGRVELRVGAKADAMHGRPVPVAGRVTLLHDGRFEETGPTHGGARYFDAGPTAVLVADAGPSIVLQTHLVQNITLQEHRSLGIEPARHHLVVAKGVNAPRFAYAPIASELIAVDTPGVTGARLDRFTYRRRPRPLFPFERDAALTA
jgi:microcystin degradation protein MlrC